MKNEISSLSKLLDEQKETISNLLAMKRESSSDNQSTRQFDVDTFRAQSARAEQELSELTKRITLLEAQNRELKSETANKDLENSKSKLNLEKLKNELETFKMFESKFDDVLRENRTLESQWKQSESDKKKVLELLEDSRLNVQSLEKRVQDIRVQNESLNRHLDQHDESKFQDLKTLKSQ